MSLLDNGTQAETVSPPPVPPASLSTCFPLLGLATGIGMTAGGGRGQGAPLALNPSSLDTLLPASHVLSLPTHHGNGSPFTPLCLAMGRGVSSGNRGGGELSFCGGTQKASGSSGIYSWKKIVSWTTMSKSVKR